MVRVEDIAEQVPEMATLTPEKEKLIQEFLGEVDARYTDKVPFYLARESTAEKRRIFGYKVLTARKWKIKNALEMVDNTVAFRAKHGMDAWKLFPCAFPLRGFDEAALCAMLRTLPGGEHLFPREGDAEVDQCYRALQTSYVNAYHYWDKEGHPVLYDCCGRAQVGQILHDLERIIPPGKSLGDVIVPYHTYMNEVQYYLIEYADRISKQAGKHPIMGITVVMDMEGLSFKVVRRKFIHVIRAIFEVDQAYYPEVLHRLFIINAPSFFRMAYDFVKGSLDENTRRKLVLSSDKKEAFEILKRVIDVDKIPHQLGGQCRCPGGCLPRYVKPSLSDGAGVESSETAVSDEEEPMETVTLKAGKELSRTYLLSRGNEITWEFSVDGRSEIFFLALFEPHAMEDALDGADNDENTSVDTSVNASPKASATSKHDFKSKGKSKSKSNKSVSSCAATAVVKLKDEKLNMDLQTYKVTDPGTLTLTFSNKHSWVHSRQVELRVFLSSADA